MGSGPGRVPGKRTLTQELEGPTGSVRAGANDATAADHGFTGSAVELPHRAQMEYAFGRSFADAQAYTGPEASAAAGSLDAHAYTVGNKIAFADPNPDARLVAHELTHVVQQHGHEGLKTKSVSEPGDALELEADRVADAVVGGGRAGAILGRGGAAISRHPKGTGRGDKDKKPDRFPWIGHIRGTSEAALRKTLKCSQASLMMGS